MDKQHNDMATPPLEMFEFCRNIGKGSYGEVTLARHKRDRKQYVLKKINLKKASTRERKSAEQEAKLLSRLKHPNIVSYKDSFEKDGYLYIAMQYCEGGDLYNKLKEQRGTLLEERQLVEWFVQIAMALQYMHERNILHRDLKTQNIFLTKSKIIKVGDLGIARVLDSSSDMATTLIGTPYYMSPELFSNKPYNHKSDVWALGCCVYEMMTLKHAFNAKDMNSLVYKILRGKMPPMPKQYSSELVSLIRSMLHQDPNKRPTVNRILRDPYIKKNIAIFLEETKQSRRPSSAARSRPSSASSQRSVGSVSSVASSRSRVSEQLPPSDEPDTGRSGVSDSARSAVSVSQVEMGPGGDVQAQPPVPAIRQIVNHRRSPSDGMRPALDPIIEHQPVVTVVKVEDDEDDSGTDTLKGKTVKDNKVKEEAPKPPSPSSSPPRASNAKRKKKSVLSKYARPDSDRSDSGISVRSESGVKKSVAAIFENPKPVDKPRPLPIPPKQDSQGLPQRRVNDYDDRVPSADSQSKSSSSSSKEEYMALDDLTPRSLPNMSARERRRRKDNNAQSYERPHSARVKLVDSSKSTVITNSERKRYEAQKQPVRHRQPSLVDDSSSSDEGTLKESESQRHNKEKNRRLFSLPLSNGHDTPPTSSHRKHIHQHQKLVNRGQNTPPGQAARNHLHVHHNRENKEMNNFITLLDNTLQLNKDDDKSDEEVQEIPEVKVTSEETPRIPKSSSMPSVDTLCNHDRLMARIKQLHADCIKGVGWEILKRAYEILGRIEEDEVEPKLVNLMGKEKFDLYAGKIWQLKFCEDMARIGLPS